MKESEEQQKGISCAAEAAQSFGAFVDTIALLRAPGGCPWDREQTHASIARNMIEEAYEAVDAIEAQDPAHLREELGDVLLQVVLQSQIAADAGEFTVADVCRDVNAKMIRRHPHVFGEDVQAQSAADVLAVWDGVKLDERRASHVTDERPDGLLDGVPTGFPALIQAYKISRKVVAVGFDWDTLDDVWAKVQEECDELREAYERGDSEAMALEFGDVLFSLVNVARKMDIDAETALRLSCAKFRDRWAFMEGAAWASGVRIEDMTMDELQQLWDKAKRQRG